MLGWLSKVSSKPGYSWMGQKEQIGTFSGQLRDMVMWL